MLEQSLIEPEELNKNNFEEFLEDETFLDYFNTFLALPCFAERLYYNKEVSQFEEFVEKLADDVGKGDAASAFQLRKLTEFKGTIYNINNNQSRIGYYVMVLDRIQAVEFIQKFRIPIFLKSELYAEYKLTIILSTIQTSLLGNYDEYEVENSISRRPSTTSFNLETCVELEDEQSNSFDDRSTPHIRTVDETFNAWQESFRRADSRSSLFGYASSGQTPDMIDRDFDRGSIAGNLYNRRRPLSRSQSAFARRPSKVTWQRSGSEISSDDSRDSQTFVDEGESLRENIDTPERLTIANTEIESSTLGQNLDNREITNGEIKTNVHTFGRGTTESNQMRENFSQEIGSEIEPDSIRQKLDIEKIESDLSRSQDIADKGTNNLEKSLDSVEKNVESDSQRQNVDVKSDCQQQNVDTVEKEAKEFESHLHQKSGDLFVERDCEVVSQQVNDCVVTNEVESDNKRQDAVERDSEKVVSDGQNAIDCVIGIEIESDRLRQNLEKSESSTIVNGLIESQTIRQNVVHENRLSGRIETEKKEMDSESKYGKTSMLKINNNNKDEKGDGFDNIDPKCTRSPEKTTVILSEMSSEVSIPIIVSDTSSDMTSAGISIANDQESNINPEKVSTDMMLETKIEQQEQDAASGPNQHENVSLASQNDVDDGSGSNERKEDEYLNDENEKNGKQLSNLSIEAEDGLTGEDNVDDFETNSEFTLQGIRGILRRRASTAATSIGFDLDQSDISECDYNDEDEKPYDLSTKDGMDEFKGFLLGTVAEKYMRLWIDMECLRHSEDKDLPFQIMLQKYFRKGSLYEITQENVKKLQLQDLSKVSYEELKLKSRRLIEPAMSYWCARFTMHQHNNSRLKSLEYSRVVEDVPRSAVRDNPTSSVTLDPEPCGMSQVTYNKKLLRPQSSRTHGDNGSRPVTAKHRTRAKSAHPRLIPAVTPMDTNAGPSQLQNITSTIRGSYGFSPKKTPQFSTDCQPDYMSSVRLFINPIPTPDGKLTRMIRKFKRTMVISEANSEPLKLDKNPSEAMMDSLIEGLILEKQTGGYFERYLHTVGNKQWINCLDFWMNLQEYNALFFADSLNPSTLSRKAMTMYARFVVDSGTQAIGVSSDIQRQVLKQVDPPYEELFDAVEDFALRCLIQPWEHLQNKEKISYKELQKEQKVRHIEIRVIARRRQSVVQTREGGEFDSEVEKEKISIDEANRPLPIPKDGFSFEMLIRNRKEVEYFREFLGKKHTKGIKDLMAWTDMETFRRLPRFMEEKRDQKAKDVKTAWLTKKYFFGLDSPATREGQDLIMNINGGRTIKERPSTPVITESQKFVRARIERRWLMLFKQTAEFLERQKPRTTAPEIVEDVMLKRRLQRSEAAWKILNSRWVSSSRDVVALRTCLLNPKSCAEFRTFVALKGDTYENDVDFWLEVQKFKDLCHTHSQESFIRRKVQAIIDCYLNSAIAPELQIDIPIEMAEKLLDRLSGRIVMHPYIFREAQMIVFRILFNHWKEFISYRSKIPDEQTLQEHLDDKLRTLRAENKTKREASERRRRARLSAERKKKEKEERERKRMEDLTSLFSIETASVFYSDAPDNELSSWFYSKHIVEQERQEHIKRLKEQGLPIPPELLEDRDDKSRRSRLSCSKLRSFDNGSSRSKHRKSVASVFENSDKDWSEKEGSKVSAQQQKQILKQQLNRRQSIAPSASLDIPRRRNSAFSRKSDKLSSKEGKILVDNNEPKTTVETTSEVKNENYKLISNEIQVIPDENDEETSKQDKLLNARSQKQKRVFYKPPQPIKKKKELSLDAISCISDYSEFSDVEFKHKKRPFSSKTKKSCSSTPLTFKSLKDFTNSPEGAPLAIPLPLVRITSASNKDAMSDDDGSQGSATKKRNVFASPQPRLHSAKRNNLHGNNQEKSIVPDVVVN